MQSECSEYHDWDSLDEFLKRLARATVYNSWDTGDVIDDSWRDEAQTWVRHREHQAKEAARDQW